MHSPFSRNSNGPPDEFVRRPNTGRLVDFIALLRPNVNRSFCTEPKVGDLGTRDRSSRCSFRAGASTDVKTVDIVRAGNNARRTIPDFGRYAHDQFRQSPGRQGRATGLRDKTTLEANAGDERNRPPPVVWRPASIPRPFEPLRGRDRPCRLPGATMRVRSGAVPGS